MATSTASRRSARGRAPRLFLLADSRLLFAREGGASPLWDAVHAALGQPPSLAAYLSAANGDDPRFHELFVAAMGNAGARAHHWVRRAFPAVDRRQLARADLIVLSGGDPEVGFATFERTGMAAAVRARVAAGALALGVSAGAVQLGLLWWGGAFGFAPYMIDVHDEGQGWARLRAALLRGDRGARGLAIASGAGVAFLGGRLAPVRGLCSELAVAGGRITEAIKSTRAADR